LIVSHSLDYLETLCDRILWLGQWRVIRESGDSASVIARYREAMHPRAILFSAARDRER